MIINRIPRCGYASNSRSSIEVGLGFLRTPHTSETRAIVPTESRASLCGVRATYLLIILGVAMDKQSPTTGAYAGRGFCWHLPRDILANA